ncbi:MAG: preprotein translocase subunit YajC [Polyangiaceae bacterium]
MTTFASMAQPSDPNSAPASGAPSGGSGGGGAGGMWQMLIFALPILLIFLMMRGQNKKQKELETSLKVGDRVVTRGGAIGKIIRRNDRNVDLELAPGVVVSFRRESIEGLDVADPKKEEGKDGKKDEAKKDDGKEKDKEAAKAGDKDAEGKKKG